MILDTLASFRKQWWRAGLTLCISLLIVATGGTNADASVSQGLLGHDVAPAVGEKGVYGKDPGQEGYYNYEDPPEEPEEPAITSEGPDSVVIVDQRPPDLSVGQLWGMHPDQFQAHFKAVTKYAVQYPTEENVLRYLTVQDVMRRKSIAFSSVVEVVGQKNPQYSTNSTFPITAPGKRAMVKMRLEEQEIVIREARDDFALIMFEQPGCSFCEAQASILAYFQQNYNWPVRSVNLNEAPNFAARYGVEITPTLLLVHKSTQEALPISSGVISMADMRRNIYRTVRLMRGEITPEQYNNYEFERGSAMDPNAISDNLRQATEEHYSRGTGR